MQESIEKRHKRIADSCISLLTNILSTELNPKNAEELKDPKKMQDLEQQRSEITKSLAAIESKLSEIAASSEERATESKGGAASALPSLSQVLSVSSSQSARPAAAMPIPKPQ